VFSLLISALAEKVYHKVFANARKTPGTAGIFAKIPRKSKKATHSCVVASPISAFADDLLCAAEDHIIDIAHDEVFKHLSFHAPFLLLSWVL